MDQLVLAEQGVFLTTDAHGEIPVGAPEALGLYYQDTRFLSGFALRVNGGVMPLLGVEDNGYAATLTYGEVAESPVRTPGIPPNVVVRRTRYIDMPDDTPHPPPHADWSLGPTRGPTAQPASPSRGEGAHNASPLARGQGERARPSDPRLGAEGLGSHGAGVRAITPLPRSGRAGWAVGSADPRDQSARAGGEGAPALRERISLTSYNRDALDVRLTLALAADFRDIFAVRQFVRAEPGAYVPPAFPAPGRIVLAYTGRDETPRQTVCHLVPAPDEAVPRSNNGDGTGELAVEARYALHLEPRQTVDIELTLALSSGVAVTAHPANEGAARPQAFEESLAATTLSHDAWLDEACTRIDTNDAAINRVLDRGLRDLRLLLLRFPTGPYMAAGIPWFAVPFGRDALIAALEMLTVNPDIAVGVLRYLAAHQGRKVNPARDEEPGKIMHEMRVGETVRRGLAPFGPYYGSVDATPLFLVLLGRTVEWLDDAALARELEPAMRAALTWLDQYGDPDGDGYIEFQRKAGGGIANQGWKDSGDSLQFRDGAYPEAPIALVEAQGYAYEARRAVAALLLRLGDEAGAAAQDERATNLRARFNRDFWLPDEGCYAQALDRDKRPVPAVTSNAGHPLWSDIADDEKAAATAARLMAADMCAGWGIRTLSTEYPSYNPISYHNGSIWPHDTAIVAAGLKRYCHDTAAATLLEQVVAAAGGYDGARLPELYAGLARHEGERGPVPYPVSCSPQAWAAGSVFLLLQSVLGLRPGADGATLHLRPSFPHGLTWVTLRGLRIGHGTISLAVEARLDGSIEVSCATTSGSHVTATAASGEPITVRLE